MQFALLIFESPEAFAARNGDETDSYLGAWRAYHKALVEAGVYVGGEPLASPETGTTVRLKEGKRHVQDGPFADTKEQLGGFTILELPSLDAALDWAARCPAASIGAVEVRPLRPNICAGSQDEWKRSGEHSPDDRARGPRVIRSSGGLPFLAHARRSQRRGRSQQCVGSCAHGLAARRRAAKSGGLAADHGAPLVHRSCASSASGRSKRANSLLLGEEPEEATLSTRFPDEQVETAVRMRPPGDRSGHAHAAHAADRSGPGCGAHRPCLSGFTDTMGQRLVRAKTKIRDGGIQFEVPQERELPQRLDAVLEAIYAAFGIGWDDMAGIDQRGRDLAEEAIWLARVLLQLMPGEAEVRGLLALMLHCEARRQARRGPDGRYIPLSEQDRAVVSALNRRGGTPSRRGVKSRTPRPLSTRSRDSVGTR